MYVADPYVDSLYGDVIKRQIESVGTLKIGFADYNTIAYAMDIVEMIYHKVMISKLDGVFFKELLLPNMKVDDSCEKKTK